MEASKKKVDSFVSYEREDNKLFLLFFIVSCLNAKFMTKSDSRSEITFLVDLAADKSASRQMLCHICLDSHKFSLLSISFLCKSEVVINAVDTTCV